jgi:hypothetical protein
MIITFFFAFKLDINKRLKLSKSFSMLEIPTSFLFKFSGFLSDFKAPEITIIEFTEIYNHD